MKDAIDDKVIIINQQDSLIKTAAKMTLEDQISKSKDANGILDFKSFLNIVDGTSVAKDLNELFGRKDTFNNSFIDVSTLCN